MVGMWRLAVAGLTFCVFAQAPQPIATRLLSAYDEDSFSLLFRRALNHFFVAEQAYRQGDYARAGAAVDSLWQRHPAGSTEWARAIAESRAVAKRAGLNFGTPACYSALRMLADCIAWRKSEALPGRPMAIRLAVVLAGYSHGVEPRTLEELHSGDGIAAAHQLDKRLAADNYSAIHESLWLFQEYVRAMTRGRLIVETNIVPPPNLDVEMYVREKPAVTGELTAKGRRQFWTAIPAALRKETDWWWFVYPAHAPESVPAFDELQFGGGGGMGRGPDGVSPAFLIDDLWVLRKPKQLGRGMYTSEERRAYLPQWFQHEFFHHLYRSWPEFHLEGPKLHDWFDRAAWPRDFEGVMESDYFAESLHKRLQPLADPPLDVRLRYRMDNPNR